MRAPEPHAFLSALPPGDGHAADVVIAGVATDGGVSFRGGAARGPRGIREFSESIETYSPRQRRDLESLTIVDCGDADDPGDAAAALLRWWDGGRRPLLVALGGDHSVTPPMVRAVARRCERAAVVGLDAHLDLRERYEGEHACTFRRIADGGVQAVVLGARSGSRQEWEDAERVLAHAGPSLDVPEFAWAALRGADVYLTVDIDVLDPSAAPGTGNPEPGGPGFGALLDAIDALGPLRVVAVDVVEVSPPLDPSGVTQVAAATLVRELILRFAQGA